MEHYVPPFSITNQMLTLVAQIAEKTGRVTGYRSFETKPHLRRNNRIRSIHSSLAIEANSLSLDEVKSVISGKAVIGPQKEIQEVKNAYQAYDMLGSFDPYSLDDLKKLHGVMTYLTVQESGVFRNHNEGVFNGDKCIFMAPPPEFVPDQMRSLFDWIRFTYQSAMLFITLPSGRRLAYVKPKIGVNKFGGESVTYEGVGATKKWERIESYGPKFVENIVQAISRDILCYAMRTLHHCFICGHIHDELIIEASRGVDLQVICEQMGRVPPWLPGAVLRADGYETEWYRKD